MSPIGEGVTALGAIIVGAVLPTEIWRWLGALVGRGLRADSEAMLWVRAVATGIIAAFVSHVIFIPAGALSTTSLTLRLFAVITAITVYALTRRNLFAGVAAGMAVIVIGLNLPV